MDLAKIYITRMVCLKDGNELHIEMENRKINISYIFQHKEDFWIRDLTSNKLYSHLKRVALPATEKSPDKVHSM